MTDREQDVLAPYVAAMRTWLEAKDGSPDILSLWLRGHDLPVSSQDEPWRVLLDMLARTMVPDRHAIFAGRLGRWLDGRDLLATLEATPDTERMYNALVLACNLSCPEILADPLARLAESQRIAVPVEWRGVGLVSVLRKALIANQVDFRHHALWKSMLVNDGHSYLGGGVDDGFAGVLAMPPAPDRLGERDVATIAEALLLVARHLDNNKERWEFREYVKQTMKVLEAARRSGSQGGDIAEVLAREFSGLPFDAWAVNSLPLYFHFLDEEMVADGIVRIVTPECIAIGILENNRCRNVGVELLNNTLPSGWRGIQLNAKSKNKAELARKNLRARLGGDYLEKSVTPHAAKLAFGGEFEAYNDMITNSICPEPSPNMH